MLNLKRGIGTHEPSVISLGQVWVDIMLNVDKVPAQGGFAVADHPKPSIGGSYRVLQAASRMGVPTEHAGILGNGLWAHFIRQSFQDNGITHIGQDRLDEDSGFRVVLSSGAPKTTSRGSRPTLPRPRAASSAEGRRPPFGVGAGGASLHHIDGEDFPCPQDDGAFAHRQNTPPQVRGQLVQPVYILLQFHFR